MTFQPAPHTAKLELIWADNQQRQWQNNFHFTKTDFVTQDLTDLAVDLEDHRGAVAHGAGVVLAADLGMIELAAVLALAWLRRASPPDIAQLSVRLGLAGLLLLLAPMAFTRAW